MNDLLVTLCLAALADVVGEPTAEDAVEELIEIDRTDASMRSESKPSI
jgi:hypothetical protein